MKQFIPWLSVLRSILFLGVVVTFALLAGGTLAYILWIFSASLVIRLFAVVLARVQLTETGIAQRGIPSITVNWTDFTQCRYRLASGVGRSYRLFVFEILDRRRSLDMVLVPRYGWTRSQRRALFGALFAASQTGAVSVDGVTLDRLKRAASLKPSTRKE